MTERVAERVRRLLHENPELEIRFTEAITRDSYYQGPVVLFLHPTHQALVDELRAESADTDGPTRSFQLLLTSLEIPMAVYQGVTR
ncbi:chemotaxis protein CheY [Arthrobacter ulcerisalmonis]